MSALLTILGILALLFLVVLVVIGVVIGMTGWKLDRRNRVDVNQSSPAPLTWLVAPTEAASLHRRLRDAALRTRQLGPLDATPTPGTVDDLRRTLLQQAALLDRDLAALGRAPRKYRREGMKTVRAQVLEVESLAHRVTDLHGRTRGADLPPGVESPDVALGQIAERVALLEKAEAEVAHLERANGLLDAEQLLRDGPPPQAPPLPRSSSQPIPTMPGPAAPAQPTRRPPPRQART